MISNTERTMSLSQGKYPGQVDSALKAVRKALKAAGWPQGKTLGRYYPFGEPQKIQEGIAVSRIGVSNTVALHWKDTRFPREPRGFAASKVAEAVALLQEKGFPFDDRGWMECQYSPSAR